MNLKKVKTILEKIKDINVLVVGDIGVDSYIIGNVNRISPEAPVPVVEVKDTYHRLGLAANVVSNVIALGGKCSLLGILGLDANAQYLRKELTNIGVDTKGLIVDEAKPTTHKTRVLASKLHHVVRIDTENTQVFCDTTKNKAIKFFDDILNDVDVVIIEDYAKGFFKDGLAQVFIQKCLKSSKTVLVDPSRYTRLDFFKGTTIFKPNLIEAQVLSGVNVTDADSFVECGNKLLQMLDAEYVVITRGKEGMTVFSKNKEIKTIPTFALEVYDVSGAGDTVIASLALAYSAGLDIYDSMFFANLTAAIVVGKVGTSTATPEELIKFLRDHDIK